MKRPILFLFTFFSLFIFNAYSQEIQNCYNAQEITIDLLENIVPNTKQNHIFSDGKGTYIFFSNALKKFDHHSHWYKISVFKETEITLLLKAFDEDNVYNFFVYQDPGVGDFCQKVFDKEIIPIRTNLLKDSMGMKGTGLSKNSSITDSLTNVDYLYYTAFHKPIYAQKDEVYYINIYHTQGEDCGYSFEMGANDQVQGFIVTDSLCYHDSVFLHPIPVPVIDEKLMDILKIKEKKFKNALILKGLLKDSITNNPIQGNIKVFTNNLKNYDQDTITNLKGEVLLIAQGSIFYEVEFSAIGYKSKKIKVMKYTLQHEMRDIGDVFLVPLQSGEHFVLPDIHFYAGTYAIKSESEPNLEKLIIFLNTYPDKKIEIQGHTNGKGNIQKKKNVSEQGPEWNFSGNEKKLSRYRADAIKKYLIQHGIDGDRIKTKGLGDSKMLYPKPKNKIERDLNKRVEIVLW